MKSPKLRLGLLFPLMAGVLMVVATPVASTLAAFTDQARMSGAHVSSGSLAVRFLGDGNENPVTATWPRLSQGEISSSTIGIKNEGSTRFSGRLAALETATNPNNPLHYMRLSVFNSQGENLVNSIPIGELDIEIGTLEPGEVSHLTIEIAWPSDSGLDISGSTTLELQLRALGNLASWTAESSATIRVPLDSSPGNSGSGKGNSGR